MCNKIKQNLTVWKNLKTNNSSDCQSDLVLRTCPKLAVLGIDNFHQTISKSNGVPVVLFTYAIKSTQVKLRQISSVWCVR